MICKNPTLEIDVSFPKYVQERSVRQAKHIWQGIPDYAYEMDYYLRQKMKAIPGIFALGKALTSTLVPKERQKYLQNAVLVSQNQFPEIYQMGLHCAETLGIGMPSIFVVQNPTLNAFTIATEDADPMIVLHSALVERLTESELLDVIGHECGHIHNNHTIYDFLARIVIGVGGYGLSFQVPALLLQLITKPIAIALMAWTRAAEVTADRAGIICAGEAESAFSSEVKLASGGMFGDKYQMPDISSFLKQYERFRNTPSRFLELLNDHPAGARRVLAGMEFINSEVFYSWHPELKQPDMRLLSKQELDARCEKYISVIKSKKVEK